MQRQTRSMLFGGAIAIMTATAAAQKAPTANGPSGDSLELAFTYNATLSHQEDGGNFWMQGGNVQIHGRFYGGLGVVADVAGAHTANMNSSRVGLDMVTAAFGPRYTWSPAHRRYAIFGQTLVGEALGFNSVFPAANGASGNANALALKVGGGVNVALGSPRIIWRAFEANWLRSQLPNSNNNVQNNAIFATGVVFKLP